MNALVCVLLIFCVLILMISFAVGPFANEPFFRLHSRFKQLTRFTQKAFQVSSLIISILCSLWLIGVFA